MWVLGALAIVYNPIFRIHMNREFWSVVNVTTIVLLTLHMWSFPGAQIASPERQAR
jgi:hypothetical protein